MPEATPIPESGVAGPVTQSVAPRAVRRVVSDFTFIAVAVGERDDTFTVQPVVAEFALVAVAGATATAVFLSTPWNNSPGFLERAQAALTPDAETVLHAKWEETWTSTDPQCTVERGPNEIWIDQTPPHRLRAVLEHPSGPAADPRALVCSSGTRSELRGSAPYGWKLSALFPGDPVKALREAISAGRAHDEGETQLAGRTVRRIRVDPERLYTYVDPDSFYPVAEHGFMGVGNGQVMARFRVVRRYLTFEYLPRTAANLALTDIRAQHPNATGP